jgi:hypothetical protein
VTGHRDFCSRRLLCAEIAVSGSEVGIAHFLRLAEHNRPVIRFMAWQLTPGSGIDTQLHFTGHATAVWQAPS